MIDDMGIFRTRIVVAHYADSTTRRELSDVMVDTGSEPKVSKRATAYLRAAQYNWIPRDVLEELGVRPEPDDAFETADGRISRRRVGFARIFAAGRSAITAVVFAEPRDMVLLGTVGLETLNLRIDLGRKELVPAGPVPVAAAA